MMGDLDDLVKQAGASGSSSAAAADALARAGLRQLHLGRLARLVEQARRQWVGDLGAPEIVVLWSLDDEQAPPAARKADEERRARGASGRARAFVHDQTLYLVGEALATLREAACALAHETVAHWGLRRLWGGRLDDILDVIARHNQEDVVAKALDCGLDPKDPAGMREAAEELLAEIAEEDRDPSMSEILEARSRALARDLFPELASMPFSRSELLVNFIAPVRDRLSGRFMRQKDQDADDARGVWSPPLRESVDLWRSALREAVAEAPMRCAPACDWAGWLRGQGSKGLKSEEISWSGLPDWLGAQGRRKVHREEVLSYLALHAVRIEETLLEDIRLRATQVTPVNAAELASALGRDPRDFDFEGISQPYALFCDDRPAAVVYARSENAAMATALAAQDREHGPRASKDQATAEPLSRRANFASYTLPGGNKYREILLRLPVSAASGRPMYRSRHWTQPNVVAHIRLNERTDTAGRRVLFVEEIQSDWAAEALRFGWVEQPATPGGPARPKAPFVAGARSWLTLAIKRIAREAVDGGFEAVAFIPSEQVLQRFDLARQIDAIEWDTVNHRGEPAREVSIKGPAGHRRTFMVCADDGTIVEGDKTLRGDDLDTIVGTDWAQTILRHRRGGDDRLGLWAGGEGLANFYDRVLPNMLRKALRELDPAAADSTHTPIDFGDAEWALMERPTSGVGDEEQEPFMRGLATRGAALGAARQVACAEPAGRDLEIRSIGGPGASCLGFTVTPGLAQAVRRGLTLFSRTRGVDASAQFRQWFEGSRIVDRDGQPLVVYHGTNRDFSVFESRLPKTVYYVEGQEVCRADSWDMGPDRDGCPHGYHYLALLDSATFGPEEALAFRAREAAGSDHPDTRRLLADLGRLQGRRVEMKTEDRPTGDGFYFTPDTNYSFIRDAGRAEGGLVMPVYLSIRNPVHLNASAIEDAGRSFAMRKYMEQGHDGAIYADDPSDLERRGYFSPTQIVAFHPHQVKSALGNAGTYDRTSTDIRFSRAAAADPERALAEQRAIGLGADPLDVQVMHDDELRYTLARLDHERRRAPMTDAKRAALTEIAARLDAATDIAGLLDLQQHLADRYGLEVADDGLVEVERLSADNSALIGSLPIAMYHHTATALLPAIARDGLVVGKQTNFFNTQAGVYLSTIRAGLPVSIYSARAARVHGGEPCTLRVRRRLFEVQPDPDDADLVWARGRQFITPSVPACDVLWDGRPEDVLAQADTDGDDEAIAGAPLRPRRAG